jgi:hypothetical protein
MEIEVGTPPVTVNVFIPQGAKKIACLVSGGADSAVLLYMLAIDAQKYGVELVTFTVPRSDGAINYSPGIVECVNRLAGTNVPMPIAIGDPDNNHHSEQTRSGHRQILKDYTDIDYIYYGSQSVASELENIEGVVYPWRPERMFYPGKTICPFFDLTKEHTLDLYFKLGIVELLKYSHTCCVWPVGRCEVCYNCIERKWAFTKLGQTDPGSI